MNTEKEKRLQKIINLIRAKRVETQQDLTAFLERAGFAVTQSGVSRDLEEIGVVKVHGIYTLPQIKNGANGLNVSLLSLESAGDALIVAKSEAGLASAVAERIDRARINGIVGTIAGENTIFIAVTETKVRRGVTKKILELF